MRHTHRNTICNVCQVIVQLSIPDKWGQFPEVILCDCTKGILRYLTPQEELISVTPTKFRTLFDQKDLHFYGTDL